MLACGSGARAEKRQRGGAGDAVLISIWELVSMATEKIWQLRGEWLPQQQHPRGCRGAKADQVMVVQTKRGGKGEEGVEGQVEARVWGGFRPGSCGTDPAGPRGCTRTFSLPGRATSGSIGGGRARMSMWQCCEPGWSLSPPPLCALQGMGAALGPALGDPQVAMFCGKLVLHLNVQTGRWEPDAFGTHTCFHTNEEIRSYCQEVSHSAPGWTP